MNGQNGGWRIGLVLAVISFVTVTACSADSIDLGNHPSTLNAFDSETGELLWTTEVPAYGRARLERVVITQVDGTLVFATGDPVGMIAVDAADGLPAWQIATDWDQIVGWRVDDEGVVIVVADDHRRLESRRQPQLMRIDPVDGRLVSAEAYLGGVDSGPFDVLVFPWPANTLIETVGQVDIWARCEPVVPKPPTPGAVCDHDSNPDIWLEGTDTVTGEPLWKKVVEQEYRSLVSASNLFYAAAAPDSVTDQRDFIFGHGPLIAIEAETGVELWQHRFPAGRLSADIVGDVLYVIHTTSS